MRSYVTSPPCLPPSFFFNDTATTEIYTLSLHDALPIWSAGGCAPLRSPATGGRPSRPSRRSPSGCSETSDRKSTRLNSSHLGISYAVFCLKKKKNEQLQHPEGKT